MEFGDGLEDKLGLWDIGVPDRVLGPGWELGPRVRTGTAKLRIAVRKDDTSFNVVVKFNINGVKHVKNCDGFLEFLHEFPVSRGIGGLLGPRGGHGRRENGPTTLGKKLERNVVYST